MAKARTWNFDLADYDNSPRVPKGWVELSDVARGVRVRVKVIEINGLPEIVGLHVESFVDEALTSDDIRTLPLRQLKTGAVSALSGDDDVLERVREAPKGGPIRRPTEHYQNVADVYSANLADAPLRAVQKAFGVSRAGASKMVKRARDLGVLGWPTQQGRPGIGADQSPYSKPNRTKKRRAQ